ncbi:MAG: hypothetical protein JSR85_00450 [Proteobacteria bacterium]|nr:hypothetical protein [Pseudomonadota bacterium]
MKKVSIALFFLLSIIGIENLSATVARAPSDTIQISAYHQQFGTAGGAVSARPMATFGFHANGTLADLRQALADHSNMRVADIGQIWIDGQKATSASLAAALVKWRAAGAGKIDFEITSPGVVGKAIQ